MTKTEGDYGGDLEGNSPGLSKSMSILRSGSQSDIKEIFHSANKRHIGVFREGNFSKTEFLTKNGRHGFIWILLIKSRK